MKKGVYLIPSLFTIGNLAAGFYSIIATINGRFEPAAWAIFIACVFDSLDGTIARLTKSNSRFGVEFDSLADVVSFGLAPAVLMYRLVLVQNGKMGAIVAFIFVAAGTLRLARFNVQSENSDNSFFSGLPIPAAGSLLASFVIVYSMFVKEVTTRNIPLLMKNIPVLYKAIPLIMVILSYLMVSNIHYTSIKKINLKKPRPFRVVIFITLAFLIIWMYPEDMILIMLSLYIISGIVDLLFRMYRLRHSRIKVKSIKLLL